MWDLLTPWVLLSVVGGFVGSLRAYTHAKNTATLAQAIANLLAGMVLAAACGERFVPHDAPFTGLFVGLMAGALGARCIDAIDALVPMFVRAILVGWLRHYGVMTPADAKDLPPDRPPEPPKPP